MYPAQTSSWKRAKNKNKKNKLVRWIVLILVFLVIINLATKVPGAVRVFTEPFPTLGTNQENNTGIDFSYRSNILLLSYISDEILLDAGVISYEPTDRRITFIDFGLEENEDLRKAVNSNFRAGGVGQVEKYISLGIFAPVNRYIALEKQEFSGSYISDVKSRLSLPKAAASIFSIDEIFGPGLKTNMDSKTYVDFLLNLREAEYDEDDYIKISSGALTSNQTSTLLENKFIDRRILEEGAAVAVRNSSGSFGLANIISEYLTRMGADVVVVESGEENESESYVSIREEKGELLNRLDEIIEFSKKESEARFPGDILIVLGEDSSQWLTVE